MHTHTHTHTEKEGGGGDMTSPFPSVPRSITLFISQCTTSSVFSAFLLPLSLSLPPSTLRGLQRQCFAGALERLTPQSCPLLSTEHSVHNLDAAARQRGFKCSSQEQSCWPRFILISQTKHIFRSSSLYQSRTGKCATQKHKDWPKTTSLPPVSSKVSVFQFCFFKHYAGKISLHFSG